MELTKWIHADLMAAEPDLRALLRDLEFSEQDLYAMLSLEQDGGGFLNVEDAACEFLKGEGSSAKWAAWLQIDNPCFGLGDDYVLDDDSMTCVKAKTLVPLFIATSVLASLLAVVAILLCCRQMAMRKYMTEMEGHLFGDTEEHSGFENPVEQAVRLMRVRAGLLLSSPYYLNPILPPPPLPSPPLLSPPLPSPPLPSPPLPSPLLNTFLLL